MRRRTYLRRGGCAIAVGLAGCLGDTNTDAANEFDYETTTTDDVAVPLVPLADVIEWYRNEDAVFADARDRTAYEAARIAGAVFSPAPDGQDGDDPLAGLSTETRIVTYCGCPHHLSTLRGASLIRDGFVHTYAIDEGFVAWRDAGYPVEGSDVAERPTPYRIAGRTDAAHAGDLAWARHEPSGQREAAPIGDDGRFTLHVRFHDVTPEERISLSTPAGEVTGRLDTLAETTVEV